MHSLFEAYKEAPENFDNIDLLCRIYETKNDELSISIAEYTNSQNPVKNRDIRANDAIQKKIALGLSNYGYYYARKKNQFIDKPKKEIIDSEKVGQAILAFYQNKPAEAKDAKRIIFAEEYDKIFSDEMDAEKILLAIQTLDYIERKKNESKREMLNTNDTSQDFIQHASFYLLYTVKKLVDIENIQLKIDDTHIISSKYIQAVQLVRNSVEHYKSQQKDRYNHRAFFKGSLPKQFIDNIIESSQHN